MKKTHLKIASICIIISIVTSVFLVNYFSKKQNSISGPSVVAASETNVVVDVGVGLYIFNNNQDVISYKDYSELSIPNSVAKLQIKGQYLYLAVSENGSLYRCHMGTWHCGVLDGFDHVARRTFGFWVGDEKIHITDTARHKYSEYDLAGNILTETRGGAVPLCYPNQLMVFNNRVYIADTNNHRITELVIDGAGKANNLDTVILAQDIDAYWAKLIQLRSMPSWCLPIGDELVGDTTDVYFERALDYNSSKLVVEPASARRGRIWPTAFARHNNGDWWVITGGDNLANGDVLIANNTGDIQRANEDGPFDPLAIVSFNGDMLVSDNSAMEVVIFSEQGNRLGVFGSAKFKNAMSALRSQRSNFSLAKNIAQKAMWFLLFAALIVALLDRKLAS